MKRVFSFFMVVCFISLASLSLTRAQEECGAEARLYAGGQGYVLPGNVIRVRTQPSTAGEQLGEIYGGTFFEVVNGFVCNGGYNWWQVRRGDLEGWAVEGDSTTYFVEPVGQADLGETIDAGSLAWSPDSQWLAIGTNTSGFLFDMNATANDPRRVGSPANDLAFRSNDELVIATRLQDNGEFGFSIYDPETGLLLEQEITGWEGEASPPPDPSYQAIYYATESPVYAYRQHRWIVAVNGTQQLFLSQIEDGSSTVDIALQPDGRSALVLYETESGGRVGMHRLNSPVAGRSLLTPLNLNINASRIAMSADGTRFAIGDNGGQVLIGEWVNPTDLREITVSDSEVQRLALTSDGVTLAVVADDELILMNAETLDIIESVVVETPASDLAFSPDGLWLALLTAQSLQVFDTVTYEVELTYTFNE